MTDNDQRYAGREAALASDSNHCFVCGPANPIGLGVKFTLDGEICRGQFTPEPQHMGYRNVTHGGIVFSLLDDVMANWLWLQGLQCFTARADIRYRSELMVSTPVQLEGRVIRSADNFVVAEASGAFMLNSG